MKLLITGRHVDVTPALKDYVTAKAERLTRFFERISRIQVTLNVEGDRHIAEMILAAGRGATLIGEEVAGDMYSAIDLVVDKLGRQLKKHKAKMRNGRRDYRARDGAAGTAETVEEEELLSYRDAVEEA